MKLSILFVFDWAGWLPYFGIHENLTVFRLWVVTILFFNGNLERRLVVAMKREQALLYKVDRLEKELKS